jgi:AcrR family transcriptional regulator
LFNIYFERRSFRAKQGKFLSETPAEKKPNRRNLLREKVLNAAEAAIAGKGLSGLKARDIAAEAGCALGAIYTVFEDLDELILRVGARTMAQLEAALAAPPETVGEDELHRLAFAYLRYARSNEPRWRALFDHRLPAGRKLPDWYAQDRDRLFGLLEAPLAKLVPQEEPALRRLRARTLFSAVHGVAVLGLEEKFAPTPESTLEAQLSDFVDIVSYGLTRSASSAPCQSSEGLR